MRIYEAAVEENTRYEIRIIAVDCNGDYSVTVGGGTHPHIGATAIGFGKMPDGSRPKYSAPVSSIVCLNHKDDIVARMLASKLADAWHTTVSVTAGIHVDDATSEELKTLQENVMKAAEQLVKEIG